MQNLSPITFAIYFGSEPATDEIASEYSFATPDLVDAFFRGISDGEGFGECNFLPHPGHFIDKDGEVIERTGAKPPALPNERYVIWGEHPHPGDIAEVVALDTPEQAAAYEEGANDIVGWNTHFLVPSSDFKPLPDFPESLDTLQEPARSALKVLVGTDDQPFEDLLFVRADGAFVDNGWTLDQPIKNLPLDVSTWTQRFDAALAQGYAHSIVDAGLSPEDVERWRAGAFERMPESAAQAFAEKYDLTPVPPPSRPPTH